MPKKYRLPLFLLVQIVVIQIVSLFPGIVEKYYSNGLYTWISSAQRWIFGWIPFSVGDVLYGLVILLLIRWLWMIRKSWKIKWKDNLLRFAGFLSIFYFLFHLLWAMNYHRMKLPEKMGFATEYSDEELIAFTRKLIVKTNAVQVAITGDTASKVVNRYSQEQVFSINHDAYSELSKRYPYFVLGRPSSKKSLISLQLSYMGFSGYLNPFTNEAQVNDMVPMYSFPATASHEMAHQIGYASESEANFVGYLAAINSNDEMLAYSGYTLALKYCLRSVEARDEKLFLSLLQSVNPGIRKNFKESRIFWEQYESFVEIGFKFFYDNFLKANKQEDGLESYSRFVDLMVNYHKSEKL
ncbi:DUF3810 domain-containing protein [Flavobacterium selenitireducens]|uniref:DUF3810 domain-containing protein n=1 Tax=Flavobacterium selenitireducens TaxID=2722704 RepID=UPI00168B2788|nr:DUF3810 domain-containing protein [Flavobacterium selenitireducens]MBD3583967.1 DUF3810 domain-containing protein [Flavobacterium selenitireducens]